MITNLTPYLSLDVAEILFQEGSRVVFRSGYEASLTEEAIAALRLQADNGIAIRRALKAAPNPAPVLLEKPPVRDLRKKRQS